MTISGKIQNRDGKLYVLYTSSEDSEPFRQHLWYRILERHRLPGSVTAPDEGDEVTTSVGEGGWRGRGGYVFVENRPDIVERVPIPPPPARGKPLRWNYGHWEKLTARGWTPAGEGTAEVTKAPRARKAKKTAHELEAEIEDALAKG